MACEPAVSYNMLAASKSERLTSIVIPVRRNFPNTKMAMTHHGRAAGQKRPPEGQLLPAERQHDNRQPSRRRRLLRITRRRPGNDGDIYWAR
jgi:hypothetical protein